MDYPFMFRSFKIKNRKQINIIREMGLKTIVYDPKRSDVKSSQHIAEPSLLEDELPEELEEEVSQERSSRIQQLKQRRISLHRCEKAFSESASAVKNLMKDMRARPRESISAAEKLVHGIVEFVTADQNATVQLVNMKGQDEDSYFHLINVTMLSMIVGKELGLDSMELDHLGMGAMLHDLGQMKIPDKILRKTSPLTEVERKAFELHPVYGRELAKKLGCLPLPVMEIIEQHHECIDGTGYPNKLKGDQISLLSRIVVITNTYDELCNGNQNTRQLTPYEAMAYMYSQSKFDKNIMSIFINRLGVYPPGTLVRLSDESIAGVTGVNHDDLLNPPVMLYNPKVPKEEAEIIDLSEEEISIKETIRRNEVSLEVLSYLNLGDSTNYFIDPGVDSS